MLFIATFRHVCIAASSLPAGALVICVLLCLATNSCVQTHCTDANFLPSLSAAVGSNEPQKTIWIISILISSAWRLLILLNSYINSRKFNSFSGGHLSLSNLPYLSSFIEIFSLNMLSIVSSSDNYSERQLYNNSFQFSTAITSVSLLCSRWST
ncbi:Post-GPI attachment to proteins factor 2 [Schistosoma haematobium]|uniref:Post-GPI attachment to proteins factor 2 n=1 Tax=Schistosoma haematobium TaxID=6185 RepID=A0A922IMU6_SCHHA|nr:Post-GPI attachment to proteins factor 2 [Schistosoma haematobium]KAH9583058.1 Post-GPI attachment to proteins factor 2 [Schistosoma haematobium]